MATPIEQQMSGVDNMNYMYSLNSTADGGMHLIVDFDVKTDPNTDLILTQMRTTQAQSQLPADVNNYGLTVQKTVTAPLMLMTLYSPNGTYDAQFLSNYAYINLADQITRLYGIGSVQIFGAGQYAMRLWVKPDQLAKLAITVPEIVSAIQAQNAVNPAGQVGSEPVPPGQEFTYSVRAQGRLTSPEEFGEIVVRGATSGAVVRLKDVARIELGAQTYTVLGRLNGKPGAIIAAYQLPGSNAVQAADGAEEVDEGSEEAISAGHRLCDVAGHDAGGDGRNQGDHRDAGDRDFAGHHRGVHLFARLARDVDSVAGGAGFAGRDIYIVSGVRIFGEHAVVVWIGAGDRVGGGRCDRRGGGSRAAHRRWTDAESGGAEGDGGNFGAGGGHRAGVVGGVRADGVYSGDYRAVVSAICGDDCDFGDFVGIQCVDVESGAVGVVAEAERRKAAGLLKRFFDGSTGHLRA